MTAPRSARRTRPADAPVRALGYCRVSTGDQVDSGAGLDAQRAALHAESARQGFALEIVTDAGLSGATLNRPALADALARLDRREADVLVAAKLDRVSRSVRDFAGRGPDDRLVVAEPLQGTPFALVHPAPGWVAVRSGPGGAGAVSACALGRGRATGGAGHVVRHACPVRVTSIRTALPNAAAAYRTSRRADRILRWNASSSIALTCRFS